MDAIVARLEEIDGVQLLTGEDTVIAVALELPIKVTRGGASPPGGGGGAAASGAKASAPLHVAYTNSLLIPGLHKIRRLIGCRSVKFVGYCGLTPRDADEAEEIRRLLEPFDCVPVFPDSEEEYNLTLDFCQNTLSPVFHSIIHLETTLQKPFDQKMWSLYLKLNRLWADCVCREIQDPDYDFIWVHDYHLLMLPLYVSRRYKKANIGLFLHCPFPAADLFRCLPVRNEILRSMLCTDLVGFHFFEYARNFLTSCKRLMAIEHRFNLGGFISIEYNGRQLHVKIGHVNVQYNGMQQQLKSDHEINKLANKFRNEYQNGTRESSVVRRSQEGPTPSATPTSTLSSSGGQQFTLGDLTALSSPVAAHYVPQPSPPAASPPKAGRRFVFLSIDRCDHLAGLKMKFESYTYYLRHFSYAPGRVTLVQYAYPQRYTNSATVKLQQELETMAEQINNEFGPKTLVLHVRPLKQKEKWAALQACDCLLDASIRDGLNLIAFEYIACRNNQPSHLILSEFTGCSSTLTCCHRIHPWQPDDVASKMDLCYSTPPSQLKEQWARDVAYLSANSLEAWAADFLTDLKRARKSDGKIYMRCGFASTYRVLSLDENFKPINIPLITKAYRSAVHHKRLLFFDHEGTLAPDRRHIVSHQSDPSGDLTDSCGGAGYIDELTASGASPSPSVVEALTKLCADPDNIVFVFSGRPKQALEEWFGDIPGIGLCAEHGFYIKSVKFTGDEWQCMSPADDFTWKELAVKLMQHYVKRTQGSFIENKGSALVFQYRNCDPDFGAWQAKELAVYLEEFLFGMPVNVISGKGYVEARITGVSKGVACQWVVDQCKGDVEFALVIGDDRSDEEMYLALQKCLAPPAQENVRSGTPLNQKSSLSDPHNVFTVTVGKKPSHAHWYATDTEEVSKLLEALIGHASQSDSLFSSSFPI